MDLKTLEATALKHLAPAALGVRRLSKMGSRWGLEKSMFYLTRSSWWQTRIARAPPSLALFGGDHKPGCLSSPSAAAECLPDYRPISFGLEVIWLCPGKPSWSHIVLDNCTSLLPPHHHLNHQVYHQQCSNMQLSGRHTAVLRAGEG